MLTFVDTGVLITAVRGQEDAALRAMAILDDPDRTFASSRYVRLEALPMPTYHKRDHEVAFLNAFFDRVSTLVKRQGLTLSPLNIVLLSDGIPDISRNSVGGAEARYANIDLGALEYLSRNVTVRLLYATATVSVKWEREIDRRRVRMWTVDDEVMRGWREHMDNGVPDDSQERLWKWMLDNVDFRVRSRLL